MQAVSNEAALILHLLRALGGTGEPGGPVRARTTYLWGKGHVAAEYGAVNPPAALDCSGLHCWAFWQAVSWMRQHLPLNSAGFLALATRLDQASPLPNAQKRVISAAQARRQRGAQLILRAKIGHAGHIGTCIGDGVIIDCSKSRGVTVRAATAVNWDCGVYFFGE